MTNVDVSVDARDSLKMIVWKINIIIPRFGAPFRDSISNAITIEAKWASSILFSLKNMINMNSSPVKRLYKSVSATNLPE